MTMTHLVQSLFRPQLKAMQAYKVADAHNLIKLDAMENPYSWPDAIKQEWLVQLQDCAINRYPDPAATSLTCSLRETNRVPVQADILLGNGSDEIIQILLMALKQNSCIMAPEPGFVMYKQVALSLGLNYLGIPLQADFSLDMPAMLDTIKTQQPAIIFLAYPNNPTGNLFAEQDIFDIIEASEGLVIVDEAYAPFTDASFMPQLPEFNNLLVMRTVSKLGLAGLRLGFLAGNSDIITELNKIRLPYNINSLTQLTAEFALNRIDFLIEQTQQIRQQRQWLFDTLKQIDGLSVYPSEANFILFKSNTVEADTVFQSLKRCGILIKNLSPQGGLLDQCLRVTVGKTHENELFIQHLTQILHP
ncbi:histidinol-phosphate transaminase [methane-oxidizing endosymbiont of Gigantopelta aegis]|uniref:histidinol-phosphate transaminase n=1 Tax=methane-oxidizing endosymbiont of Gigantopelta aegis TaxID=2794938 RepID=UPI0018DCBC44|nr:histidinol-phosphate transaminase [methane-oxidizing endosymbiont of Gigantopelta aegis]